jgi:hypothetical protein
MSQILAQYRYGNQGATSSITLYDDGRIEHFEGAPYAPTPKHTPALTAEQLDEFLDHAKGALTTDLSNHVGSRTSMGSESGELLVLDDAGELVPVKQILRAENPMDPILGRDTVKVRENEAAKWIEGFFELIAETDMYDPVE